MAGAPEPGRHGPADDPDGPGTHDDDGLGASAQAVRRPAGDVYDWLSRGRALLARGDAGAAATLLRHAHAAEPGSPELVETLARAEFEIGRFGEARELFAALVEDAPDSDYARFGLGASLVRLGRHRDALPHLVMASVMRPDRAEYEALLARARTVTGTGTGTGTGAGDAPGPGPADGPDDPADGTDDPRAAPDDPTAAPDDRKQDRP